MAAGQELAADVDGQWLFRHGDLVLGPVSGSQIVEKLKTGELTPDSPLALAGERDFHPIKDVEPFKVHVALSEARVRVDAAVLVEREKNRKRVMVLGGVAGALALVLGSAGLLLARNAAVHGWFGEDEFEGIEMEAPVIRVAQARQDNEELFDYPTQGSARPTKPGETGTAKPANGTGKPTAVASASRTEDRKPPRPSGSVNTDAEGMEVAQQFDQSAINRIVAGNKSTLFKCFKEEAERSPGLATKIPLEFVIGNDGKVNKLWVDNPQFKKGPLYDCLFTELQKWPFRAYDGERATVGLSFNIGKRG
ncbi:AgmX/PglI C-terminal domain-containing protein [Myxococcus llanfairpwllgwyngyllgogerychwyrndrobwllllantysiliogogogochensis]|uniref:AgmX/PglI C-terminal domain-containing protein n=1 Tax=Myxococcus llanfairpwllgwyngyllgogerychwyrndrobwllllantysiliogogogochensis TaxID=2590453 RepID=A0A540WWY4_9BACT|nr:MULTISPECIES: AgmX/PglI C-terminal domain-containing protein [Myxococcus]NTX16551.1 AgmX/PglI C-terminal domain-containing protein [Myxococcus sp. CA056]NTX54764.1 AgmX/PglI C-terminal domain-containing protein [Myxococcus sp. CA039A]TQF13503.1 AgmX/PglI C-terminal domain-containing protein [Myxococcus llanfairpwllgwyngyllgogerychwyrndrobwllllantysiliogogogochensis]